MTQSYKFKNLNEASVKSDEIYRVTGIKPFIFIEKKYYIVVTEK